MYIDLHVHSKITRKVDFNLKHFENICKIAKFNGLTAIALTEHFDVINFKDIYEKIKEKYEYKFDYFDVNGFKVFSGIEIDVKGKANLLVIGNLKNIYEIRDMFKEEISEDDYIEINELNRIAKERDMLIIGAHPFREKHPLYQYDRLYVTGLDAVELNGKDILLKDKMYEYAEDLNMPIVAGSDAHTIFQIGTVKTHIEKECKTAMELREEIINNRFNIKISKFANIKNKISKKYKKYVLDKNKIR